MKDDAISVFCEKKFQQMASKETLNRAGLIYLASGIDPYEDTPAAYLESYRVPIPGRVLRQLPAE